MAPAPGKTPVTWFLALPLQAWEWLSGNCLTLLLVRDLSTVISSFNSAHIYQYFLKLSKLIHSRVPFASCGSSMTCYHLKTEHLPFFWLICRIYSWDSSCAVSDMLRQSCDPFSSSIPCVSQTHFKCLWIWGYLIYHLHSLARVLRSMFTNENYEKIT